MSKTLDNLMEAFAGESQANRKYLAYAEQADKEGYASVAKLFRAAAAAETVHAHSHLRVAHKVGSTKDNLKDAVAGETHEFKDMYPKMIEEAQAEGNTAAVRTFTFANEVEKIHAGLYQNALDTLEAGEAVECYHVCRVCGHTVANAAPEKCPVCNSGQKAYFKVD